MPMSQIGYVLAAISIHVKFNRSQLYQPHAPQNNEMIHVSGPASSAKIMTCSISPIGKIPQARPQADNFSAREPCARVVSGQRELLQLQALALRCYVPSAHLLSKLNKLRARSVRSFSVSIEYIKKNVWTRSTSQYSMHFQNRSEIMI